MYPHNGVIYEGGKPITTPDPLVVPGAMLACGCGKLVTGDIVVFDPDCELHTKISQLELQFNGSQELP